MNNIVHLHVHTESLLDADMNKEKVVKKIKELNMPGIAITNHGVVADMYDYEALFKEEGLKLGYGCEIYMAIYVNNISIGRFHACVLAMDELGWQGICKLITLSNRNTQNGFPIVTMEMLEDLFGKYGKYHGHVIFTSACMQGVIPAIFRMNEQIEKSIQKNVKKQSKLVSPSDNRISIRENDLIKTNSLLDALIEEKTTVEKYAKMSFTKREKELAKLLAKKSEDYEQAKKMYDEDVLKSKDAIARLPILKKDIVATRKKVSGIVKELKQLNESIESWLEIENTIVELKKEIKSDEELYTLAIKMAKKYLSIFGENFYIEIQYHRIPEEVNCFLQSVKVAKELNIPLVATNDVHIIDNSQEERLRRQLIRSIRFDTFQEESVGDAELYFKSKEEMEEILSEIYSKDVIEEALNNTNVIFDKLNVVRNPGKHYPKYDDGSNRSLDEMFDECIKEGVKWRFPNGMDEEHQKRLKYEMDIIKSMGYVEYHLVVKDFLEFARLCGYIPEEKLDEIPLTIPELKEYIKQHGYKNPGMTTGPGRGSGVGSLVCYNLGITHIDPLKYDLLFERFLNPERVSMPDIDSDISKGVREKTIEYVCNKFGRDAVCLIMTKQAQAPKGCIRNAARFYGQYKYGEKLTSLGDKIAKYVPFAPNISFDSYIDEKDKSKGTVLTLLNNTFANNKDALEIIKWAKITEGIKTSYGEHAAGVVISDNKDISDYLPLRNNQSSGFMDSQCNMVQVEENGLLKMDFLGLVTLNIITDAMRFIEQEHGIIIDPLNLDVNDIKIYNNIFSRGLTNAVFQFESDGMKSMLKRFKPTCFEDLIILVSMFRPGPIQYLDDVIKVKNKELPMTFLCPELKPILGKTYGAIVYQEQVMEIFQKLAGYTLGGADMVRRYMSKKKAEKLEKEQKAFVYGDESRNIKGCVANGISEEVAIELFEQMKEFAKYAFNKSHATAYALNAFITAWLKYYYPSEFFAAAMNWATNQKIQGLMNEARICGVTVRCPHINYSMSRFSIQNGEVLFGIGAIKGIKGNAQKIIDARNEAPFISLKDFIIRTNISVSNIESLIDAGAFDDFSSNRAGMKLNVEKIKATNKKMVEMKEKIETLKFVLSHFDEIKTSEDAVKLQLDNGYKVYFEKLSKRDALEKRIEKAMQSYSLCEDLFNSFTIPNIDEDKIERLNKEKELLGIYVTGHPIDFYPKQEDVTELMDLNKNSKYAFGVVENLEIKNRKADGKEMAFFELTDYSGTIKASCFTKSFEKLKEKLVYSEGKAFIFIGKLNIEKVGEDEDGNDIFEKNFIVENIQGVDPIKCAFYMSVSSYPIFHVTKEAEFIEKYAVESDGHPLYIYDEMMDEMRLATYKVSDLALISECVIK